MARYIVATHRAIVVRDWLCRACEAYGRVAVPAKGSGRKRLWFSRAAASDAAHEIAAIDLQDDANRIVQLIRCPKCRRRAPHAELATVLHAIPDLGLALCVAVAVVLLLAAASVSVEVGFGGGLIAFALAIWFGDERRRWRTARVAQIELGGAPKRAMTAPVGPPAPTQRPAAISGDPFRELPAPPPIAVERPAVQTAAPVVADDSAGKPTFLT